MKRNEREEVAQHPEGVQRAENFTPVEFQAAARHPVMGEGVVQVPIRAHPEPESPPESMMMREKP